MSILTYISLSVIGLYFLAKIADYLTEKFLEVAIFGSMGFYLKKKILKVLRLGKKVEICGTFKISSEMLFKECPKESTKKLLESATKELNLIFKIGWENDKAIVQILNKKEHIKYNLNIRLIEKDEDEETIVRREVTGIAININSKFRIGFLENELHDLQLFVLNLMTAAQQISICDFSSLRIKIEVPKTEMNLSHWIKNSTFNIFLMLESSEENLYAEVHKNAIIFETPILSLSSSIIKKISDAVFSYYTSRIFS